MAGQELNLIGGASENLNTTEQAVESTRTVIFNDEILIGRD